MVCRHCAKWNLVPFDTRLETIDACERLFRDTRTRFSTDQIGLAKVTEGLELVRIGEALRPEFASWRYGAQYRKRRRKAMIAGGASVAVVGAGMIGLGAAGVALGSMGYLTYQVLNAGWKYGLERAARVVVQHPDTAKPLRLGTDTFKGSVFSWESDRPALDVPLLRNKGTKYLSLSGDALRSSGRKVVGGLNILSGQKKDLSAAAGLLAEHTGDLEPWLKLRTLQIARRGQVNASWKFSGTAESKYLPRYTTPYLPLKLLQADERLAVEMWMNEDIERTWLEGELKLLEREWRDAERLGKIADDLELEPEE